MECPGDTLKELLGNRAIDIHSFSGKTGIPAATIEGILSGDVPIDKEIAGKLERYLVFSIEYWLSLEKRYRKAKRNLQSLNRR